MPQFILNAELCHKDAFCAKVCPLGIITMDEEGLPRHVSNGSARCISCGQCVAYCPSRACNIEGLPAEEVLPVTRSNLASPEALLHLAQSRRSIRLYKETPVPKETIEQVLEIARFAPTAKHSQCIRWVIVYNRTTLLEQVGMVIDWMLSLASSLPEAQGQETLRLANSWKKGKDPILRGAPHLAVAVTPTSWPYGTIDATIAVSHFELAATSYGLGCCWAGYFSRAAHEHSPLRTALGLKRDESVTASIMFGYPYLRASNIPPRKHADITWK